MLHLDIKKRNTGTKSAREVIKGGRIPGVVYGPKTPSTPVSISAKKFHDVYKKAGGTTLIALDYASEKQEKADSDKKRPAGADRRPAGVDTPETMKEAENVVLIRDTQTHPVKGDFIHVDFYQLPLDKPIEISVPIESQNEAPAVKEQGGILVHNLHEIDIKALPKDLIHDITVDISGLENFGDSILVKDLNVNEKVEILAEDDQVVFFIEEPREEEEPEEEVEGEEGDEIADIKTEGEEKREEREAEKAEEGEEPKKEKQPEQKEEK